MLYKGDAVSIVSALDVMKAEAGSPGGWEGLLMLLRGKNRRSPVYLPMQGAHVPICGLAGVR